MGREAGTFPSYFSAPNRPMPINSGTARAPAATCSTWISFPQAQRDNLHVGLDRDTSSGTYPPGIEVGLPFWNIDDALASAGALEETSGSVHHQPHLPPFAHAHAMQGRPNAPGASCSSRFRALLPTRSAWAASSVRSRLRWAGHLLARCTQTLDEFGVPDERTQRRRHQLPSRREARAIRREDSGARGHAPGRRSRRHMRIVPPRSGRLRSHLLWRRGDWVGGRVSSGVEPDGALNRRGWSTCAGSGSAWPCGTVVGRYVVITWIGEGGAGVVYSAYDPELDRKVALKLLRPRDSASDEERVRLALSREARAMAKLAHPNVAVIYDIGAFDGRVFIAMEFVEGVTLRRWLEDANYLTADVYSGRMFLGCGRGLAAAHQAGLVHRDFKPENVLVGGDGRARVTDFGLARPREECSAEAPGDADAQGARARQSTESRAVVGTPAYMAPKQKLGQADARSDQFSFCVALYEALCGAHPTDASTSAREEASHNHALFLALPLRVQRTLDRGLKTDPADRYSSMADLLGELDQELRGPARRAWTLVVAAVVSVAGIGFGVSQRVAHARDPVCTGAQDNLKGVWDESRKQGVARAMRATGKPFAEDAWHGVERVLDAYAHDWAAERTGACEATRVRGEQSEAVLDLRMQCFDRRLLDLRELTEALSHANVRSVESAVQAAEGLIAPRVVLRCVRARRAVRRILPSAH